MPSSLRVLTANIHQLRDDRSAVVAVLRGAAPDVVAIQEPPRGPLGGLRLRRLARDAGLRVAVGGGAARTTALLVRDGLEVLGARAVALPWTPGRTRRGIALADVAGVRVMSVHLSLHPAERALHLGRVLLLVGATPGPCVVAGDLNERPGGPSWDRLLRQLRDATAASGPTYPAHEPRSRIDAVLVAGLDADGAEVVPGEAARRASDHLPVVVDVHLGRGR
ncbi:endonuclease/exonuclease/phosphatase family protein [Actinotalea sp.]|uniref:endonuclease/exonuclease/phosphatase family protein n=1 Tax=Actinotalea sp. TaxID=1872145 RepID=UPI002C82E5FB|nr:endonuclease/exonuclease/phosphatase family protein [Actinotalea sp.]HQY34727.1 endonuclease/exonuclease/phosphatase family protein [Actinotalea sp.]HRA49659.1 endonuclease/exonuclease/phosphatase family protein [Actinotalea sp.]